MSAINGSPSYQRSITEIRVCGLPLDELTAHFLCGFPAED